MERTHVFLWDCYGTSFCLPRQAHRESPNSFWTKKRKNLRRKWRKRKEFRKYRKLDENVIKRKRRKKTETESVTKIGKRIAEKDEVAVETGPRAVLVERDLVHHVRRTIRKILRKMHLADGIRKTSKKSKRRRKRQTVMCLSKISLPRLSRPSKNQRLLNQSCQ